MRHLALFGCLVIIYTSASFSQNDSLRVMFYNVENLFDTQDNPLKDDDDFLPDGFMRWTPWKYWEKLRRITQVITAVGEMHSPAIVGLCEVENDSVLFHLTRRSPLRAQQYEFIITSSPDERGINVALLYQRHQFKPLQHNEYEITLNHLNRRPTRNILHVTGMLSNLDTLDVFVCHFPSRREGKQKTEKARIAAASLLREKSDSIMSTRSHPNCVIMGDFNATPNSKSLIDALRTRAPNQSDKPHPADSLYNLFFAVSRQREAGTYKYQGKWEIIDHFIVNGNLLYENNSTHVKNSKAYIFEDSFLLEDDERYYGKKPYRTNLGPRHHGGFSDHLPIYLDLTIKY